MQTLIGRNVNQLWARAVPLLRSVGHIESNARTGKQVLVAPHPVMSVTLEPRERVLFDPARDANPFFHLFECLWMMAGRNDAEFLNTFVRDFGERFAEKDGIIYGAYGNRWRRAFEVDQIETVIARLRADPTDRRTVIAMWSPNDDLLEPNVEDETGKPYPEPRDVPCNTHIYLRVQPGLPGGPGEPSDAPRLDLTVCCRSNDIVWGAYGANIVHFSFLQEYLAGMLNVEVGTLYQLSNNWHAYKDVLGDYSARSDDLRKQRPDVRSHDAYERLTVQPMPIGDHWASWMRDLGLFMKEPMGLGTYVNRWFDSVARPMFETHSLWKRGERKVALQHVDRVAASDWHLAARQWMERRA